MADLNAILVKPKISKWRRFIAALASDFDKLDLNHQIYVPERFVLGNFKKRKDEFELSQGGIFYKDSSEVLAQYQKYLDDEKLEVVQSLLLPETVLETIVQQGRAYFDARRQISESVQSVDQYFV